MTKFYCTFTIVTSHHVTLFAPSMSGAVQRIGDFMRGFTAAHSESNWRIDSISTKPTRGVKYDEWH